MIKMLLLVIGLLGTPEQKFDDGTIYRVGSDIYVGEVKQDFTGCLGMAVPFLIDEEHVIEVSPEYWDEFHYNTKGN